MSYVKDLREIVFERDNYQCVYCKTKDNLTLGHYVSKYNNGHGCIDNLQTECRSCNMNNGKENRKGGVITGCWGCTKPTMKTFYRKKKYNNQIIGFRFSCLNCNIYETEEGSLYDLLIKKNNHFSECVTSGVCKGHITELTSLQ